MNDTLFDHITPTTREVRSRWIAFTPQLAGFTTAPAEFDRWLAQHDAEVRGRVTLIDDEILALASILNKLTDREVSDLVNSHAAWLAYTSARLTISNAADAIVHESRAARRAL